MSIFDVSAPPTVKAGDDAKALKLARAGVVVKKRVAVPPSSPPVPDFIRGKELLYRDDSSKPDPVAAGRWAIYAMENKQRTQNSSTALSNVMPGRFTQVPSGDLFGGKPFYQFHAPPGDHIWVDADGGRSEISYPVGGDQGNVPHYAGPDGTFYYHEGRTYVIQFDTVLPPSWDVTRPWWRVIHQLKQSEWLDPSGISPALALEERAGHYIVTQFGRDIIWSTEVASAEELHWAWEVTFSSDSSVGRVVMHLDRDLDGVYEYSSTPWTGKTLNGVPSVSHLGLYEDLAGDTIYHRDLRIWGTKA